MLSPIYAPILVGPLRGCRWSLGSRGKLARVLLGTYEPRVTSWFLESVSAGDSMFDVGANAGYYTVLGGRIVGNSGQVVAIEPASENVHNLHNNVRTNQLTNVKVFQGVAGDKNGTVRFHDGAGTGTGHISKEGRSEIPMRSLDDLATAYDVVPTTLKIDVEGAELRVLRGATRHRRQVARILHAHIEHAGLAVGLDEERQAAVFLGELDRNQRQHLGLEALAVETGHRETELARQDVDQVPLADEAHAYQGAAQGPPAALLLSQGRVELALADASGLDQEFADAELLRHRGPPSAWIGATAPRPYEGGKRGIPLGDGGDRRARRSVGAPGHRAAGLGKKAAAAPVVDRVEGGLFARAAVEDVGPAAIFSSNSWTFLEASSVESGRQPRSATTAISIEVAILLMEPLDSVMELIFSESKWRRVPIPNPAAQAGNR